MRSLPVLVSRRDDDALLGLALDDRIILVAAEAKPGIGGHVELALFDLGIMAGEAILLEDGGDVLDEADLVLGPGRRRGGEQHEPGHGQAEQGTKDAVAAICGSEHGLPQQVGKFGRGELTTQHISI